MQQVSNCLASQLLRKQDHCLLENLLSYRFCLGYFIEVKFQLMRRVERVVLVPINMMGTMMVRTTTG